jgi:copper transport protein
MRIYFLIWGSLLETTYGDWPLIFHAVAVLMLAVAAINRKRLTPALNRSKEWASARTGAARSLRRNVLLEQALGAVVILLVAVLGVSSPPMRM